MPTPLPLYALNDYSLNTYSNFSVGRAAHDCHTFALLESVRGVSEDLWQKLSQKLQRLVLSLRMNSKNLDWPTVPRCST